MAFFVQGFHQDIRKQVLDVAQRITFTRGVSALRVDELAHELGMSKKTLYTHYASKAHLLEAMMAAHCQHYEARFQAVRDQLNQGFLGGLQTTMQLGWEISSKMTAEVIQDFRRHAPALWQAYEQRKEQGIQAHFRELLHEGQRQGFLRDNLRLDIIVDILMEVITYHLTPNAHRPRPYAVQEAHATFYQLLFEGLLQERARQQYAQLTASNPADPA